LLRSKVRLSSKSRLKGTATLFEDRISINCRSILGSFKREFKLSELESYKWWAGRTDSNFAFYLKDGEDILVVLKGAGNWKSALDEKFKERIGQNQTPPGELESDLNIEALLKPLKYYDQ